MFYKNCRLFAGDLHFHIGAFEVTEDGRFGQVLPEAVPEDAVDLGGATVIPGLIDVHIHGAAGEDISDSSVQGLHIMGSFLAESGITSYLPATVSQPYPVLEKSFLAAKQAAETSDDRCARLLGVHMEGPFFSYGKRGAHNPAHLRNADFSAFEQLQKSCGNIVKIADVAPELPGGMDFIRQAKELCTVSVAHTCADYSAASAAFAAGATHLTHLFNGMPSLHHREPGVIAAAAENKNVRAELICDGMHVHPSMVRLAFSMFPDRIMIISDALRCCGLPDGEYTTGDQTCILSDGIARLTDGTICGAATNIYDGLRNVLSWGIEEEVAVRAATWNPACAIGVETQVGVIAPGAWADFLVCSLDYSEKQVYLGGKLL